MKKLFLVAIMSFLSLTICGCFGQNETVSPAPLPNNNNNAITHHLFYLGESKDWIGEYEVSGETIDGSKYSDNSKGILTLTYKGRDYSSKDKVTYGLDSVSSKSRESGYMSPNGILVLNTNNEDAAWLENNPSYTITVTVKLHDQTEAFNLSLKSK